VISPSDAESGHGKTFKLLSELTAQLIGIRDDFIGMETFFLLYFVFDFKIFSFLDSKTKTKTYFLPPHTSPLTFSAEAFEVRATDIMSISITREKG
jgi:hypothetical protein